MRVIVDTNVLVGRLDAADVHHGRAVELLREVTRLGGSPLFLDCVVIEVIGVLCRRRRDRRRPMDLPDFVALFPLHEVTPAYDLLAASWAAVIKDVTASNGSLNAHDALILAYARHAEVSLVASFDRGLRQRGLTILESVDEVAAALQPVATAG